MMYFCTFWITLFFNEYGRTHNLNYELHYCMRIFFANKFKVFNQYSWDKRYLSHEQIVERRRELINDVVLPTLGKVLANTYKHIIVNIVIAAFLRLYWPTCQTWPIYISFATSSFMLYNEFLITYLFNLEPLEQIFPENFPHQYADYANRYASLFYLGVKPFEEDNNEPTPPAESEQNEKFNRYNKRNMGLVLCASASLFLALYFIHWTIGKASVWMLAKTLCGFVDSFPELSQLYVGCNKEFF